jgi:aryl-alcohol dehydrogenase-like predicted oxidoreductase
VRKVASETAAQPAEVALAWLLSKPGVAAPIIGATRIEHLDSVVKSLDVRLTDDQVKAVEAPYRPHAIKGM